MRFRAGNQNHFTSTPSNTNRRAQKIIFATSPSVASRRFRSAFLLPRRAAMPRPRRAPAGDAPAGGAGETKAGDRREEEEAPSILDETGGEIGPEVLRELREQWELASVLNFLSVRPCRASIARWFLWFLVNARRLFGSGTRKRNALKRAVDFDDRLQRLQVFEPVIGKDLKLSPEEIEGGLVRPNSSIARLHIKLLKVLTHSWPRAYVGSFYDYTACRLG